MWVVAIRGGNRTHSGLARRGFRTDRVRILNEAEALDIFVHALEDAIEGCLKGNISSGLNKVAPVDRPCHGSPVRTNLIRPVSQIASEMDP